MRRDQSAVVSVSFITLLALGTRLAVVSQSVFPLNDGGLFYGFISDLILNGLRLPALSAYNAASIPLAYPPAAFYLTAILHLASGIPILNLMQYGPVLLSVASLPAFYLLAVDLLGSPTQAGLATFAFAFIPRTFEWLIMGGGITRALGLLFSLLLMRQLLRLFAGRSKAAILPCAVLGSLLAASHPEATVDTALTAALLYIWRDRSLAGLGRAAAAGAGIMALSAPWWALVLARHGLDPFIAAAAAARADSYNALVGALALLRFQFTDEPFVMVFAVLGLVGFATKLARREWFLPTWFVILHTLEPRGGTLIMMIPLAMAAGFALETVILPALQSKPPDVPGTSSRGNAPASKAWLIELLSEPAPRVFLIFLALYGSLAAYEAGSRIEREFTLGAGDLQAFDWVRQHTPRGSTFALVTQDLPLRDATSDWFPALTNRGSLATVFGMEWKRDIDFDGRIELYRSLQACAAQGEACLQSWAQQNALAPDYVYVREQAGGLRTALDVSLMQSAQYVIAYAAADVNIYQRR